MVVHISSIEKLQNGRKEKTLDISQQNQRQQYNSDKSTSTISKEHSSVSPVVSSGLHQIITKTMEIDTCYESRLVENSCTTMERFGARGGMTQPTNGRRRKQRSQRRGRTCAMNVTDFEQATEFLHHFHAITSRSLDVIHETIDSDDKDESGATMMDRSEQSPSHGRSTMRRTKTCSCLLEAQTSATNGTHHGWFLEDSHDDDEWGFYSEEFDPSWSTSTRTVNQGIAPLRH